MQGVYPVEVNVVKLSSYYTSSPALSTGCRLVAGYLGSDVIYHVSVDNVSVKKN